MKKEESFSRRYGYRKAPGEIKVREDAPTELREAIVQIAREAGLQPSAIRAVVCRVLKRLEDPNNWSEYPNIWQEVQDLIMGCDWWKIYDICEALYDRIASAEFFDTAITQTEFENQLNECFVSFGIGWQMIDGRIWSRGSDEFEHLIGGADALLGKTQRVTARNELTEAMQDLSRRPEPDITGVIQHSIAALECVARDISGDNKATLGQILRLHPNILNIPRPLDDGLAKMWGYASEMGRHLREGRTPSRREAELVLGVSASIIAYLCK